jgi:hypothetical protein
MRQPDFCEALKMDLYFWINEEAKLPLFFVVVVLTIIVSIALWQIGKSQRTDEAPRGMISLQLANADKAKKIVESWQNEKRDDAFLNLGVDYLYLFLYPIALSLACNLPAKSFEIGWAKNLGLWLSVISLLPLVFDAVENYAIIQMLKTKVYEPWANVARFSAIPKFSIVAVALLYVSTTFAAKCVGWLTSRT